MALYLGSSNEKLKIYLNGVKYKLNLYSSNPIISNGKLLSSEGYILRDLNGVYLLVKESE